MTVFRRTIYLGLLVSCLFFAGPQPISARQAQAQDELLREQNQQLHRQLRDARREIARLKAEGSAPGWQEVVTGLGLIFGLSGIVMMVKARRR